MIRDKATYRESVIDDRNAIFELHSLAFGREDEASLTNALLSAEPLKTIDLVAELDGRIMGHVLLTELEGPDRALALAPVAVHPDWRDLQIGTELIRRALDMARQRGWRSVFVLGDTVFYGRFGFRSDLADCVDCPFQGPNFMALELEPGALFGYAGKLVYPAPFMG